LGPLQPIAQQRPRDGLSPARERRELGGRCDREPLLARTRPDRQDAVRGRQSRTWW